MAIYGELTNSIIRQINRSRRSITILFTDIENSTQYWDKYGDVKGRLMVDQHNRLVFPIIHHFNGRVIKTIGDAVMASFKQPEAALKAAIGIQQALEKMRQQDSSFQLRVRIGLHTGKAIVEDTDVFGDVVNVASRIESKGKGDQILASSNTVSKLDKKAFHLNKQGQFSPKGKRKEIILYNCEWKKYEDLTKHFKYRARLPLVPRQKRDLLVYTALFLGGAYFIFLKYLRYVLADSEELALVYLNPAQLFIQNPMVSWISLAAIVLLLAVFWSVHSIPRFIPHIIKGGFGFALVFMFFYWPLQFVKFDQEQYWNDILYESSHLFVRVLEDGVGVYKEPVIISERISVVNKNNLLLLSDVAKRQGFTWNKVLVGQNQFGWIERITPRGKRVTVTKKFYFRYRDLYPLLIGLLGFIWGIFDFRIKPT